MNLRDTVSREFFVYVAVGGVGFAVLATLLKHRGTATSIVLLGGMLFGWLLHFLELRLKARRDARRRLNRDDAAAEGALE